MSQSPSLTTFVVGERLPWPDGFAAGDEARSYDPAIVYQTGFAKKCALRRISALGAIVRGELTNSPEQHVALELETGQRPPGTIAWQEGNETGIRFKEPVNLLALITRKLVSQPAERRALPRVELRCDAWIKDGDEFAGAVLRNISARGLQLQGDSLPAAGATISLFVEGLNIPAGEVVWRKDDLAGVELQHDLSWVSIIPWIRALVRLDPQSVPISATAEVRPSV
jgi:hypothetical protein